jgi:Holliday junction DNA helicase RuvB|tara:strand:+ start:988 stop:1917 length:930 start_codon:yes stop_codon:yes gene_type:complete
MVTTEFPDIIGQDNAKRVLDFFCNGYKQTNIMPHLMFVAPKGCGKTTMAKATARRLKAINRDKRYFEINCSTIKNVKQFFNQLVIPYMQDRDATILFDECSEIPKDVTMALLTILNPNPDNQTSFTLEDYTVDFDFRRLSFMFATTETQSVFHALMDRLERVDLEEYTLDEMGKIVCLNLDISVEPKALKDIASVLRGNARAAQKMAQKIESYCKQYKIKKFDYSHWNKLGKILSIYPLGLNITEIILLNILKDNKDCSLTKLSAKTGISKQAVQRDFEIYLQKHSLMDITTAGRNITAKGTEYLKKLA